MLAVAAATHFVDISISDQVIIGQNQRTVKKDEVFQQNLKDKEVTIGMCVHLKHNEY